MKGGIKALLATTLLASVGCTADKGALEVRPIADPLTKAIGPGDPAVAEARGLLVIGSVGLAIEAFRKIVRDRPDSVEALAGLAECYDQMGRYDLSRAKYEAALAIAPKSPVLLRTFAASLERQGRHAEALALRAEAGAAEQAKALAIALPRPVTTRAAPQAAPATVAASQPKPAAVRALAPAVQPKPAPKPAPAVAILPKPVPAPVAADAIHPKPAPAPVRVARAEAPAPVSKTVWKIDAAAAPLPAATASITVKLPPARPAEAPPAVAATPPLVQPVRLAAVDLARIEAPTALAAGPSVTVKLPPPAAPAAQPVKAAAVAPLAPPVPAVAPRAGPHLERMSLGEVALVTEPRPRWKAAPVRYAAVGATPRFVPLGDLRRKPGLRLLNAARHEGLAARTRLAMNRRGWTGVTIGDSDRVRRKSLILYSEATEQAARRLAARLGIWIAREARPGPLTILLGRDWVNRSQPEA